MYQQEIQELQEWVSSNFKLEESVQKALVNDGAYEEDVTRWAKSNCNLTITASGGTTGYSVCLRHPQVGGLINFIVSAYPTCCAMISLHSFTYSSRYATKEQLYLLLDKLLPSIADQYGAWKNKRIIIAMVEDVTVSAGHVASLREELTIAHNPEKIKYKWFYDYLTERGRIAHNNRFVNNNTNRIINLMEVLFPLTWTGSM